MTNKILHIVGTRPQYIKLFPLWSAINDDTTITQEIYDTGQHYDKNMSEELIKEFGFESISYGKIAGFGPEKQIPMMIENIWNKLVSFKPDYVFLYGDTNSTMAGSIACAKLGVPYGHLEAGVRTEEHVGIQEGVNRKVADHLATHHFCVNKLDHSNVAKEGLPSDRNHLVGDLMYDAFHIMSECLNEVQSVKERILVTIHRAENVDDDERRGLILETLIELSKNAEVLLPLHPRLKAKASREELAKLESSSVKVIEPLKYSEVINTLNSATGVVTDSGGLPKDAAYAGVKSVVLRDDPIWKELHQLGYIHTVDALDDMTSESLKDYCLAKLDGSIQSYRSEMATNKIIDIVKSHLNTK
ncbi:UDP-N-acetylglucosamine 2-epimerase [Vibrio orientalis CIP 102891 = ATCC 33934]|uniref:UDP-N-acetylglucosamine 2-epimerase n=1 Tax=Vibrio orientalis CIP 102891 = ATCC 33934 TaxID=675816 RepID=C9QDG1_VIBOR|nr:UDP-N-acetylglucosamine 2-epimerase [Vibrio orientalis]EEX95063.1 UDP-N-acetylglucosamine 2-epimerase [Vibrio orientalis CIP 102891 = ATCC 33934]EGU52124.1 UDP-N-acetylglucosamine 2-epimerase [Vibrio orientalis CIP 102891 = ATCC 33934]